MRHMPKLNPSCQRIRGGKLTPVDKCIKSRLGMNVKTESQVNTSTTPQSNRRPLRRRSSLATTGGYTSDRNRGETPSRVRRSPSAPSRTRVSRAEATSQSRPPSAPSRTEATSQSRIPDRAPSTTSAPRRSPVRNNIKMRKNPVTRSSLDRDVLSQAERLNIHRDNSADVPAQSTSSSAAAAAAPPPVPPRSSSLQPFYRGSFLAVRSRTMEEVMRRPPPRRHYASLTLMTTRVNPRRRDNASFPFVWPRFWKVPSTPQINLLQNQWSRSSSSKSTWSWRKLVPNWLHRSKSRVSEEGK